MRTRIEADPAWRVVVTACNRPGRLALLLRDLRRERRRHHFDVVVYDDGSEPFLLPVVQRELRSAKYERLGNVRHGRERMWQVIDRLLASCARTDYEYFFILEDDLRLCRRFFERAFAAWRSIEDPALSALTLMRDERYEAQQWHDAPVLEAPGGCFRLGWLDGIFMFDRTFLDALGAEVLPVSLSRWSEGSLLGSGVGPQLSLRLRAAGRAAYGVGKSLVVHAAVNTSVQNPAARREHPLRSRFFVDGEARQAELEAEGANER